MSENPPHNPVIPVDLDKMKDLVEKRQAALAESAKIQSEKKESTQEAPSTNPIINLNHRIRSISTPKSSSEGAPIIELESVYTPHEATAPEQILAQKGVETPDPWIKERIEMAVANARSWNVFTDDVKPVRNPAPEVPEEFLKIKAVKRRLSQKTNDNTQNAIDVSLPLQDAEEKKSKKIPVKIGSVKYKLEGVNKIEKKESVKQGTEGAAEAVPESKESLEGKSEKKAEGASESKKEDSEKTEKKAKPKGKKLKDMSGKEKMRFVATQAKVWGGRAAWVGAGGVALSAAGLVAGAMWAPTLGFAGVGTFCAGILSYIGGALVIDGLGAKFIKAFFSDGGIQELANAALGWAGFSWGKGGGGGGAKPKKAASHDDHGHGGGDSHGAAAAHH